jgi:hypothetical protein
MSRVKDSQASSMQTTTGGETRRSYPLPRQKHQGQLALSMPCSSVHSLASPQRACGDSEPESKRFSHVHHNHNLARTEVVCCQITGDISTRFRAWASALAGVDPRLFTTFIPSHPSPGQLCQHPASPTKHVVDRSILFSTRPSAVCCCRIALSRHVGQIREGDDDQDDGRRCRRGQQSEGW